jgi:predicted anti-sigma-YlaC factor YlaD
MTCRGFIAFLDDYLSGPLQPQARALFDEHLRACVDCRNYLDSYRKTVEIEKRAFASVDDDLALGAVSQPFIRTVLRATARFRR